MPPATETTSQVWEFVAAERASCVALGRSLSESQWASASLCAGWTVGDVFAHLAFLATSSAPSIVALLVRSRFDVDRMLDRGAKRSAKVGKSSVLDRLEAATTSRSLPPKATPAGILSDTITHQLDVCRPLNISARIPTAHLLMALDNTVRATSPVNASARAADWRLVATDLPWSHGNGPEVEGTGEELLLALCGRRSVHQSLTGSGMNAFAKRA